MRFIDLDTDREYTLADMKNDWKQFKAEDIENHCADFPTELFEIVMATVNGRNNLDIVGLTPREISNIVARLRSRS